MIEDTQCLYTGRVIGSAVLVEGRLELGANIYWSAEITSPPGIP
jgi:hypothetical protein